MFIGNQCGRPLVLMRVVCVVDVFEDEEDVFGDGEDVFGNEDVFGEGEQDGVHVHGSVQ